MEVVDYRLLVNEQRLRAGIVSGLFAILFIIFLAGDIWVWRGAMLEELSSWVAEEGGEEAFWGASILYSALILLAFCVSIFEAKWFRWLVLTCLLLLCFSILGKMLGGYAEYPEVGWYFFLLFGIQMMISVITAWLSYRWARLETVN